jgi:TatD DNase family protein
VRLIDSHCHLQADRFDEDVEVVVGAARLAGVERILVPGWDLASSKGAVGLVERFPWLHAAVGIHPHNAAPLDEPDWAQIVALADDPRVVAIGETGLDFDRVFSPIDDQLANLRRHLALAIELGKPAILHVRSAPGARDAQDALIAELSASGFGGPSAAAAFGDRPGAIIHSFSGPPDYANAVLDLGLAISISGLAFRAGEESTAEVAQLVSLDRLLIETDSPFLSPPGAPRRRNEPEWVRLTADWVAARRGIQPDELGDALVAAYDRTFPGSAARRG